MGTRYKVVLLRTEFSTGVLACGGSGGGRDNNCICALLRSTSRLRVECDLAKHDDIALQVRRHCYFLWHIHRMPSSSLRQDTFGPGLVLEVSPAPDVRVWRAVRATFLCCMPRSPTGLVLHQSQSGRFMWSSISRASLLWVRSTYECSVIISAARLPPVIVYEYTTIHGS